MQSGRNGKWLSKCREAALVDSCLDIAISNAFEINHRRRNIAVSHPLLRRTDVDSVLEMSRSVRMAKFVEEPSSAVESVRTAIHLHRFSVFQFVSHHTVAAVEFGPKSYGLELLQHGTIGFPGFAREDRIIGTRISGTKLLQEIDQFLWNRNLALFPILGMKSPVRLCSHAHCHVLEVDVAPCDKASFRIPKTRHQIKLKPSLLRWCASLEEFCQFSILIYGANCLNELGPIGGVESGVLNGRRTAAYPALEPDIKAAGAEFVNAMQRLTERWCPRVLGLIILPGYGNSFAC